MVSVTRYVAHGQKEAANSPTEHDMTMQYHCDEFREDDTALSH